MTAPSGWWCPNCGHTVNAVAADQPHPEPTPHVAQDACALCGANPARGFASITESNGTVRWLCHPDVGQDCYHLWTVFGDRPPVGVPVGDDTPADERNIAGLYPPGRCSLCGKPTPDPEQQDVCDDCYHGEHEVGDDTPAPEPDFETLMVWLIKNQLTFTYGDQRYRVSRVGDDDESPWGWLGDDLLYTHGDGDTCVTRVTCAPVREALDYALNRAGATPDLTALRDAFDVYERSRDAFEGAVGTNEDIAAVGVALVKAKDAVLAAVAALVRSAQNDTDHG